MVPNTLVEERADATPPVNEAFCGAGVPQVNKVPVGIMFPLPLVGVNVNGEPVHTMV